MGFAPAAAIGAKIGAPDRTVICLVGDGGFLSVCGALTTAVELGIPVVWVLFNNFCFSTIRTVGTPTSSNSYGTEFTHARRRAVQPRLPACWPRRSASTPRGSTSPAICRRRSQTALAAKRPYLLEVRDARRRADAAHRLLGHRRLPGARQ